MFYLDNQNSNKSTIIPIAILISEPTQIYRFLRTRNQISVSSSWLKGNDCIIAAQFLLFNIQLIQSKQISKIGNIKLLKKFESTNSFIGERNKVYDISFLPNL